MARTEISAEERDALYDRMLVDLNGIDDLRMAFQAENFERAARLSTEFGDKLRLMEDLGWGYPSSTDPIKLTMPPEQLHRVFARLRSESTSLRREEEQEEAEIEEEAREHRDRAARITQSCDRVLKMVDQPSSATEPREEAT